MYESPPLIATAIRPIATLYLVTTPQHHWPVEVELVVFCDDGVEESANEVGKEEKSLTYYFYRYKKKKFKMKRETNTITYISKHMSYGVNNYLRIPA